MSSDIKGSEYKAENSDVLNNKLVNNSSSIFDKFIFKTPEMQLDPQLTASCRFDEESIKRSNQYILDSSLLHRHNGYETYNANQIDPQVPNESRQFDKVFITPSNQHMSDNSLSHSHHVSEIGKHVSPCQINGNKVSTINPDNTMLNNAPNNTLEVARNNQKPHLSKGSIQIDQGLLTNSKVKDGLLNVDTSNRLPNHLVSNEKRTINMVCETNQKRKVSSDFILKDLSQIDKKSKHEIASIRKQYLSNNSEAFCAEYDLSIDTNVIRNRMPSDNCHLAGIYQELPTIKELNSHTQVAQQIGNLNPIEENVPPNINQLQGSQNETERREISYYEESKVIAHSVDDILVVDSGASGFQNEVLKNRNTSFQFSSPLEQQSAATDTEMICKYCIKEISKHCIKQRGKNIFKCCICDYTTEEIVKIQIHINVYRLIHYYCIVCEEVFVKEGSHDRLVTCNTKTCKKKFLCIGLLEQHAIVHNQNYNCIICNRYFYEHIYRYLEKLYYQCCQCTFKGRMTELQKHIYIHTGLRLFKCDMCGKRYAYDCDLINHYKLH